MLEEYARRNGLGNIRHFTDDGISSTRFDRPGFVAMLEQIEKGNVKVVCIKDMSRLGRDYLKVGMYMETMRKMGVTPIGIRCKSAHRIKADNVMEIAAEMIWEVIRHIKQGNDRQYAVIPPHCRY